MTIESLDPRKKLFVVAKRYENLSVVSHRALKHGERPLRDLEFLFESNLLLVKLGVGGIEEFRHAFGRTVDARRAGRRMYKARPRSSPVRRPTRVLCLSDLGRLLLTTDRNAEWSAIVNNAPWRTWSSRPRSVSTLLRTVLITWKRADYKPVK